MLGADLMSRDVLHQLLEQITDTGVRTAATYQLHRQQVRRRGVLDEIAVKGHRSCEVSARAVARVRARSSGRVGGT